MLKVFDIPFIMHCDELLFKKSILNLSKNPEFIKKPYFFEKTLRVFSPI